MAPVGPHYNEFILFRRLKMF